MTEQMTASVMTVVRVHTERGSHIEPPLGEDWPDVDKLRWHAAVFTADYGVPVLIHPIEHDGQTVYSVQFGNTSHGGVPFNPAWQLISGASAGARAVMQLYDPGPDAARWNPSPRGELT